MRIEIKDTQEFYGEVLDALHTRLKEMGATWTKETDYTVKADIDAYTLLKLMGAKLNKNYGKE